ncbi:3-oxoadipate enol-lactonase [Jannaschia sp. S6380]|uniref:3-oxoadipate enol-lactonase n=1 Tax=Jannaschia sp. S6380 TaxID=2926408 RepID=UPI001FF6DC2E|nr:3-oxoadipate enol-lactonase [Jannaschia sp. S6380]MCK0167823.1 3-oxoadipate enol-lactonase [Jannaschia sp. S6380]
MRIAARDGTRLHIAETGPPDGRPLVFANSLGTDLRIWDDVLPRLPDGLRIMRYDMRGHGLSDVPDPPYGMGTLVADAEAVLDTLDVRASCFVGLSIGGMVAQGLAVKRPDLVGALVLSNTAARIGTEALWDRRIADVRRHGLDTMADGVMERWFGRDFRASGALPMWRARFCETPPDGYVGCCAAIRGGDFYTPTSGLRLPTLVIAGSEDGTTPPDLIRETAALIPGSEFAIIRRAGHLPPIEAPAEFGRVLAAFLNRPDVSALASPGTRR